MNKKEAEDFIYKSYLKAAKYQDYHVKDSKKRRNDLTFDLIQKKSNTPCVVVTGSKGKGSVANMISQILQTKFMVGLMTSPHIVDFCERFQINGRRISDSDFVEIVSKIQPYIEAIDQSIPKDVCISPMGVQTLLALQYFEKMGTQFNVFECGKGAKYDDVNNVKHEYAVINSIFLEHTRELGETLEEIAEDKAHVITGEQKCVYVAEQNPDVMKLILKRSEQLGVLIKVYGRDFSAKNIKYIKEGMLFDVVIGEEVYSDILIPLLGEHQAKNCALALAVCIDIFKNTDFANLLKENEKSNKQNILKEKKIKENLLNLSWSGRMEVISKNPFVLLDACINRSSCRNVLEVLKQLNMKEVTLIVGIPDDKDYQGVVKEMKEVASKIILTKSQNLHYIFTRKQQECLEKNEITTEWTESVSKAMELATKEKKPIVILGTTSVIAEVKNKEMQKYFT